MIEGIRHIIFDLGGILLDIDYKRTMLAFEQLGVTDIQQIFDTLQQEQVFDRLDTGALTAEGFIDTLRTASGLSLSDTEITHAWNALLIEFPLRRLQLLQQLQLHYDLVLLSNTNAIHEQRFNQILQEERGIPNIGVFFDKVYFSHRIGMRKPELPIYERVLTDCGFKPAQTLFIDDLSKNTEAAEQLGIRTILLEPGMSIEKDIFRSLEQ
jgi:putative hydrolase of the HAD superfamily